MATQRDKRRATGTGIRRVLLVDDDDDSRALLTALLGTMGYLVTPAASADQGLSLINSGAEFDAAVADVLMPGTSGVDFLRLARKVRPKLPIALVTGFPEGIDVATKGGAIPLLKPFTHEQLEAAWMDARPPKSHQDGSDLGPRNIGTILPMANRGIVSNASGPKDPRAKLPYVAPTFARHDKPSEAAAHKNADAVYTLYRGSTADPSVRFHVATFDTDGGEEHNHALCEYARGMFQEQAREQERFWCERGYFRPVAER